jgi:hypothetical protein
VSLPLVNTSIAETFASMQLQMAAMNNHLAD